MAGKEEKTGTEPRGFGKHTRGLAGEYAHEQGWGLDEEQRRKLDVSPKDTDGGTDYQYGAQDFGDEPVNAKRIGADGNDAVKRANVRLGVPEKKSA